MAIRNCCWIRTDAVSQFVYSIVVVDESDFGYLSGIWGDFYPGDFIIWQDDMNPSPGYYHPVGEGWRLESSGTWSNPNAEPWFPPEE